MCWRKTPSVTLKLFAVSNEVREEYPEPQAWSQASGRTAFSYYIQARTGDPNRGKKEGKGIKPSFHLVPI